MGRLLASICYDGTVYHGWQVQQNAVTVQQTMQNALESVVGYRPDITGCSRTDSGVHASQFCFHFDYDGRIPTEQLVKALNARLPMDIAVLSCRPVPDGFHARYSVKSKEYRYRIWNGAVRSPFERRTGWHIPYPLDDSRMNKAAQAFVGRHDFCGFCSSGSSVSDTVRTVKRCSVRRDGELVTVSIEADGFLYNMVRIIVGTLVFVSAGKIAPEELEAVIASGDRDRAGPTAPPQGLFLHRVHYGTEQE